MGSLWFANPRIAALTTSPGSDRIAAVQRSGSPARCRLSQRIGLTLNGIQVIPMTHHVECVALLEKADSDLR